VTNAQIATLRFANRALVTSGNGVGRYSGGLSSAARRRRCAPTPFPPSLRLRATFPARRPQTEAVTNRKRNWVNWTIVKLNKAKSIVLRVGVYWICENEISYCSAILV
jgi:hypothetical protein